jgi:diadenylate cyclase
VVDRGAEPLIEALALIAPGRPLRDGLDRVLQGKRGALVVVGDDPAVLSICTGGFLLDAEFTPQRLSELAKMDGAIILAADASRIARANVHLMPRSSIPTSETGTRHRTAERVARSVDVPVVTVSEAMATIAVFRGDRKHRVAPTARLLDQAGQALSTLQRFKKRFDVALAMLSTSEVEDTVSVREVVAVLQPGEMVVRIGEEIDSHLVELGEEGRLIHLQLEEVAAGTDDTLRLVLRDYLPASHRGSRTHRLEGHRGPSANGADDESVERAMHALHALGADELLDPNEAAATLGVDLVADGLDTGLSTRGYRMLHRVPRMSTAIIDRIVERFTTLPAIMQASLGDLEEVGGVGAAKARSVKDGLTRIVEASVLERYE